MICDKELNIINNVLIDTALLAGKFIEKHFNSNFRILTKSFGSSKASNILTEVDINSQKIILNSLTPICKKYDFAFLSEEYTDDLKRFQKKFFFCIDPLDGTLYFSKGKTGFSVSIALVSKNHIPYIGVVYDPLSKKLYHAIKGKGAYKNLKRWKIDTTPHSTIDTLTVLIDQNIKTNKHFYHFINQFKKKVGHDIKFVNYGGAVINAISVLNQKANVYFKFPKKNLGGGNLWDYAATSCIFKEHRGISTDFFGKKLKLNNRKSVFFNESGVIFSTDKKIHNLILSTYKEYIINNI